MTTQTYQSVFGLAIFVNTILLLGVLQVSWRFRVIANLLQKGVGMFAAFFIQFSIIDIAFVRFFYTHFGKSRMEYNTFIRTAGSMFAVFLGGGGNFKLGVAAGEDQFGRFMMITFCITMVFAYTNVFISMIIKLLDDASSIASANEKLDLDPVGYVRQGVVKQLREFRNFAQQVKNMLIKMKKGHHRNK